MLSTTPMVGPVSDLQTLDLQLQPGSASALAQVTPLITAAGGGDVQATTISGLYTVQVPSSNMAALARQLAADPAVQYASPAQTLQIQNAPNDPQYTAGIQWALNGAWGINAPAAWNTTTGSYQVIVADIDTGINYNHPDLVDNLWLNQAELPSGLTDANSAGLITFGDLNAPANSRFFPTTDGSGYIDGTDVLNNFSSTSTRDGDTSHPGDYLGWDFFDNTNSPLDQNGHGTVTAGEIGAVGNNGIGVTGVNWNVQLMDLQAFNSAGAGFDIFCAEAIDYAVNHGAKVINASWGFDWVDPTIAQAIQYADQHGVILVAAAGNNGSDDDTNFFAPASYSAQYPNVITVAATDSNGNLASWSNYGVGTVQLAAPGVNIDSTMGGSYGYMSGTSMAAPLVTGTVALVEAAHPSWTMGQVIGAVLDHTTADPNLAGKVTTGGIVNAAAAVANTDGAYVTAAVPNGQGTSSSPLSSVQVTFNEEINPATFTPAQVTLTGPGGTISGVSVSVVAGSNDHQFVIAFPTQTGGGSYTLKVGPSIQDWYGNAMDQNRNGQNGAASNAFVTTFYNTPATATLVGRNTTAQGNWIGTYGTQGYNVIGNAASDPAYATVTTTGASSWTWAASTTDPRALQTVGGAGRIAATWYSSTSFTVDVDLTDGQVHSLALYALDWDSLGRSEQIQLSSATTGAVLDTETISSFSGGVYLQWNISGNVVIKVTNLLGQYNAVLSGLFLDAAASATPTPAPSPTPTATAALVGRNTTTQGNWIGTYGTQGYNIIGNAVSYPAYATITPAGASSYTWAASTTALSALQTANGFSRIEACWYSSTSFTVDVDLTDGQAHDLTLYAADFGETNVRSEQIQLSSATTGAVLDTETISSFSGGVYLQWDVSGNVVITVTNLAGPNAVLSGLFFDPPPSTSSVATASLVEGTAVAQTSAIGVPGSPASSAMGILDFSSMSVPAPLPSGFSFTAEVGVPTFRQAASGAQRPEQ